MATTTTATVKAATATAMAKQQNAQSSDVDVDTATLQTLLELPSRMELSQIELMYRAEGNANLVLALPQFKKVLRLPKCVVPATATATTITAPETNLQTVSSDCNLKSPQAQSELLLPLEQQKPHKLAEKASDTTELKSQSKDNLTMKDFATYTQILRQILGSAYVLNPDVCRIRHETDRKWINKHIRAARPVHRLDKEFCGQFGLLLPDATQLPSMQADILHSNFQPERKKVNDNCTYAIEIKPKQGWQLFPNPDASSSITSSPSSHLDIKDLFDIRPTIPPTPPDLPAYPALASTPTAAKLARTTVARCRYCAMQFLKLKNHKILHMNEYCPIELFSGSPSRMLIALDALFRCPQNNLRVFKNGILIYGDHTNSISYEELQENLFPGDTFEMVKNLLVECLLRDFTESVVGEENIKITEMLSSVAGQPHSSVALTPKASNKRTMAPTSPPTQDPDPETKTKMKASCGENVQEKQAAAAMAKVQTSTTTLKRTAKTTTAITAALPHEIVETSTSTKTSVSSRIMCSDAELKCLPENCILHKILHLQLLVKHNLRAMNEAGYKNQKLKSYNSLKSLLAQAEPANLANIRPNEAYLLGATALDCSIMITFREIAFETEQLNDPCVIKLTDHNGEFQTKVTVLDLDPKPDSHYSKYIQQTIEAYEESSKDH